MRMRRKDREVTDFGEIKEIMERCDVCRLGFWDGTGVYIVPLNFGLRAREGRTELYFHSAREGKKTALIQKGGEVTFEMDCAHALFTDEQKGRCTMYYESVMGKGVLQIVAEEEKTDALKCLMAHYHREEFPFGTQAVPNTLVYKLAVTEMTAKRHAPKA